MKKFLTYLTLLLLLFQQMGGITYAAEQYEITVNLSWSCERYHYDPITVEIRL
ncbi:MAG: hypothetical protein LBI53_03060 [Candidatus Peribacteria bacterium]|jgi:hypothetical protein|nr:hypothetical protein [Candidatus Peribacteria bacterium]